MAQQSDQLAAPTAGAMQRTSGSTRGDVLSREQLRSNPGYYARAWRRYRRSKLGMTALAIVL